MSNKQIEDFVDLMFNCNIEEEIKKETKILEIVKERNELRKKIDKAIEYIKKNRENTEQKLDFDEMKTYNVALLELLKILGGKENE